MNQVFGVHTPDQAREKIQAELIPNAVPSNLEEWCLSTIGPTLYHLFIEGYTQKQWNRHPTQLPADIVKRLPVRFCHDDNYYNARYQGIPVNGYTEIVEKMLQDSTVILNTDFLQDAKNWIDQYDYVIYTGPIDAYFEHRYGHLEYRSLRFENEIVDTPDYQGCAVINYTDVDPPYTRIIEHKHFYMNSHTAQTLITREYPQDWQPGSIEYYPVNDTKNQTLFEKYQQQAELLQGQVHFGGRLSEYRYYDMDQIIGSALSFCKKFLNSRK
jgi:UDP-galactopyranose mutase